MTAWYYDAVRFVSENGLMNGLSVNQFAPDANLSRAQLTQILYNKAGQPAAGGSGFAQTAVHWAVEAGILNGKGNNILDPKGLATRAEVAQMLKNNLDN